MIYKPLTEFISTLYKKDRKSWTCKVELTYIAPPTWWLEDDPFLLKWSLFRGHVHFRAGKPGSFSVEKQWQCVQNGKNLCLILTPAITTVKHLEGGPKLFGTKTDFRVPLLQATFKKKAAKNQIEGIEQRKIPFKKMLQSLVQHQGLPNIWNKKTDFGETQTLHHSSSKKTPRKKFHNSRKSWALVGGCFPNKKTCQSSNSAHKK